MSVLYIGSGYDAVFIDAAIKQCAIDDPVYVPVKGEMTQEGKVRLINSSGEELFYKYSGKGTAKLERYNPAQRAPEIIKIPLTGVTLAIAPNTAKVGTAYSSTSVTPTPAPANATGVTYTYAISGAGAAGLTCNSSTGAVTGTPTAAGSATVTVTAKDDSGTTKTGTAAVTVSAA